MRIWQEGIEPLENPQEPVKEEKTGHCFFDDYRVSLKYNYNKKDGVSGVGMLSYAPSGLIWCQTGYYCLNLDEFASYYYGLQGVLEEAKKSKSKNLTIYFDNQKFVEMVNLKKKPYKLDVHNKIHDSLIGILKEFDSYKILFRDKYPNGIAERLKKEAIRTSEAPEFNMMGRWQNSPNISYYNIMTQTEEQKKAYAEQYAHMFYDFHKSYMKEYEQDYGEESIKKLIQDMNSGKVKKLPDVKRVKETRVRFTKVKNPPKLKKDPICQNCGDVMEVEDCQKKYPEKQLVYYLRCKKCKASKDVLENGRVLVFRKYPNKKK
jgi:hypothetical protein